MLDCTVGRNLVLLALAATCAGAACKSDADSDKPNVPPIPAEDDSCDPKSPKVCVGPDVVACEPTGRLGRRLRACHDGCTAGRCKRSCDDDEMQMIYAVDSANDLLRFDPKKLPGDPFTVVGKLGCDDFGSPFSMSVDRNGSAWVVYNSGNLFKVSIDDASCESTGFRAGAIGSRTFGMGFVTAGVGSKDERLFLAQNDSTHQLISMSTDTLKFSTHGRIEAAEAQNPELTGTGEGHLFGFFPSDFGTSFIQEIDKGSGGSIGDKLVVGDLGNVTAYAFAHWGGTFYVFATGNLLNNVHAVSRTTGTSTMVQRNTPYNITGAGVSTCAPERDGLRKDP